MKTLALIGLLAMCGGVSASQPISRTIHGEVAALHGTAVRLLASKPEDVSAVYSIAPNGTRIDYTVGIDYVITETGIARTSESAIYDFDGYSVTLGTHGKYTWVDAPRNPPLVLNHHVYVDYTAKRGFDVIPALASSPANGRLLVTGDSIAGGAHTTSWVAWYENGQSYQLVLHEAYVGLLADHFDGQMKVSRFWEDGGGLQGLIDEMPNILSDPPERMIIAYGMNDHSNGPSYLSTFTSLLSGVVAQLKNAGVKIVLVGFPRKNPLWDGYSLADIIAYNDAIETVARQSDVPFVDMESAFEQTRKVKTTVELFGDNHHHPSNYAHRIYFSMILPHLLSEPISESQAPAYLRIP